jgi:hypothetical protein
MNQLVQPKRKPMIHAYRLIYLKSPHAPPPLWEWEQPWIHNLIVNARSFNTTRVEQRYFRDWDALALENIHIWEEHYRSRPLYDHIETWEKWLNALQLLLALSQHLRCPLLVIE